MKGRVLFLVGLLALVTAIARGEGTPGTREHPISDNGRYQLFQGTYTSFDLKRQETYSQQAVFLIDTRTGQVKRYVNKIDTEGKYIEMWLPTDLPVEKK